MPKIKSVYICQECGYESLKWLGKCPDCNNWNSLVEEVRESQKTSSKSKETITRVLDNMPKNILEIQSGDKKRYNTGLKELNRVLGGGLVRGSLTLISGDPGIGKSTLLLQTSNNIANEYGKVLYVSGTQQYFFSLIYKIIYFLKFLKK